MFAPIDSAPLVKLSVPEMVRFEFKLTPFVLLTVKLLRAVTPLGINTPLEEPPKTRLEEDVVDRLATIPAIAGPSSSRVFAPTKNVPLVKVRVPSTVTSPIRLTPFAQLMVRLFNVT